MDPLTHLAIPLTVAYVLRPDLFPDARYLAVGAIALVPDLDKLVGLPGLGHSLLATVAISVAIVAIARAADAIPYAVLAIALLHSHLVLDVLDGGPVTLLYPLIEQGVGLTYPTQLVLDGPVATVDQPLPQVRIARTNPGRRSYPLVTGYGVLSALTFVAVYWGRAVTDRR